MPIRALDHCAMCDAPWPESTYCPSCQEVYDEIVACPGCGRPNPPHGDMCPSCEADECPLCHGATDDPGNLCPACAEVRDEIMTDDEED